MLKDVKSHEIFMVYMIYIRYINLMNNTNEIVSIDHVIINDISKQQFSENIDYLNNAYRNKPYYVETCKIS